MGASSARAFVAAFQSAGLEAASVPSSDNRTLELSGRHISGDECFPLRVVLGDFLKVVEDLGPDRVAFFLPTTCGPCRFGQYSQYLKKVLQKLGYDGVPILSPSSSNGYDGATVGSTAFDSNDISDMDVVKVIERDGMAIDFYRTLSSTMPEGKMLKHIGLYAYRRDFLFQFAAQPPSSRERELRLEQLRALDMGVKIGLITTNYTSLAVDTPADLERIVADWHD